jgi:simple sugar transport system ATP-binding protein
MLPCAAVPLLELRGLGKRFGAVRALRGVDLTVERGEVVGLMGDNGAGKSTLLEIVAGSHAPSEGELLLAGEPVRLAGPADARARGIEAVHQDLALCPNLSAAENVFLGRELVRRGRLERTTMDARTRELFAELKAEVEPGARVRTLSGGQRQAVAIARALLARARLVLLDEPTAAIGVAQVAEVLGLVRRLRERGVGVVLVSHRMQDVFAVADRLVVLRRGEKVADTPIARSSFEEATAFITGAR